MSEVRKDQDSKLGTEEEGRVLKVLRLMWGNFYAWNDDGKGYGGTPPIEPQYRKQYIVTPEEVRLGRVRPKKETMYQAGMVTVSPIDDLRQTIKIQNVDRTKFFGLQKGFRKEVLSRPVNAWAFKIARYDQVSDLNIKERKAVIRALKRAQSQNSNVFSRAVEQSGIPGGGRYHPLKKAYLNAAEYDQLAISAMIRMVEFSSSLAAEQAIPEAAR
jgi:hypothetical protein